MKILKSTIILLFIVFTFLDANAQKANKKTMSIKPGEYLFNTTDLYFFDDGIDCYLLKKCRDVDTVFENKAETLKVSADTNIKYQAYLFTDTYEYVYTKIKKKQGWLRISIPLTIAEKKYFKSFIASPNYESYSCYVEVIPFKKWKNVFISNTDNWFISDLNNFKTTKIGTKGGRLEACQMVYSKNCVKCYIDLGWGENVWYNSKGKKTRTKTK